MGATRHPATILTGAVELSKEAQKEADEMAKARAAYDLLPEAEKDMRKVLAGIQRLKKSGVDRKTLNKVRRELDRKGTRRGRRTANNADWKIETLEKLAIGLPWKKAVTHFTGVDAAQQGIRKYCREVYRLSRNLNLTPEDWQRFESGDGNADLLNLMFGFNLPQDIGALIEACRRGERSARARAARPKSNPS